MYLMSITTFISVCFPHKASDLAKGISTVLHLTANVKHSMCSVWYFSSKKKSEHGNKYLISFPSTQKKKKFNLHQ